VEPFGDAALLVDLGDRADPAATAGADAIAAALDRIRDDQPGLGRAVPAHASVLVPFDPLRVDRAESLRLVHSAVREALAAAAPPGSPARTVAAMGAGARNAGPIEIPVRYGGDEGPDLDDVAKRLGLAPADAIRRHSAATYHVLFLGFAPGFAYLGGLPAELVAPRRATPRERVPAGSVAIAGEHTAVYPQTMPGGWNLIGRTEAALFDPFATPPARLEPGAAVRFVDVTDT
jgi:KipI family sensor histidine kinase inhibitor